MSAKESVMEQPMILPSYPKVGPRSGSSGSDVRSEDSRSSWASTKAHSENISSVADNPFYKSFGRKHHIPPAFVRTTGDYGPGRQRRGSSSGVVGRDNDGDDDIGEYHPGSGFVHKLLDRFSSMSNDASAPEPAFKRAASLEDLLGTDTVKAETSLSEKNSETTRSDQKTAPPLLSTAPKLSYSQRAKSIESLNNVHQRPLHSSRHRPPQLVVPLRKRSEEKQQVLSPRSPRESVHVEAPDVDLARKDIIIIETTPSVPKALAKEDSAEQSDSGSDHGPLSYREEHPAEELPKPNTVHTVRSIFETATAATFMRHPRVEMRSKPKPTLTSPFTSPRTSDIVPDFSRDNRLSSSRLSQSSVDSASEGTSSSTPREAPSPVSVVSPLMSPTEEKAPLPNVAPPTSQELSTPRSDTSESSDTSSTLSSIVDRRSMFDSPRLIGSARPMPSPRNTASVKPTVVTAKPSAVVKPAPLNIPASTATSYKRSSPVVPVAPFKETKESDKDDGQPVMIFDRSKLGSTKTKPKRARAYDSVEIKEQTKPSSKTDLIIPKSSKSEYKDEDKSITDMKQKTESKSNRLSSSLENGTAKAPKEDKPKITLTEQKTVIELSRTPNHSLEKDNLSDRAPQLITFNKENTNAAPVKPVAPRRRFAPSQQTTKVPALSPKETAAPRPDTKPEEPAKPEPKNEEPPKLVTKRPEPPKLETEVKGKMLYVSSSESSSGDSDATPPTTPRRGGENQEEDSGSQPIKGIPSIIAQRMRKQNADPSKTANGVTPSIISNRDSSLETTSSTKQEPEFITRSNLISAAENKKPAPADDISNEIENEIAAVRKKMEGNKSKTSGVAQIFDSSQLAKKRKENQRKRQESLAAQGIVPPLDLSSITDEQQRREYQQRVPQVIKPCNIVFVGENAPTSRSLLKKQRKVKLLPSPYQIRMIDEGPRCRQGHREKQ